MKLPWAARFLPAAVLAAAVAAPAAGAPTRPTPLAEPVAYQELPAGRYGIQITGMLTTTCARGIEEELQKLPEVESAKVDFETETLSLTIKLKHSLRVKALRKALHRAADLVNLGADYSAGKITFLP